MRIEEAGAWGGGGGGRTGGGGLSNQSTLNLGKRPSSHRRRSQQQRPYPAESVLGHTSHATVFRHRGGGGGTRGSINPAVACGPSIFQRRRRKQPGTLGGKNKGAPSPPSPLAGGGELIIAECRCLYLSPTPPVTRIQSAVVSCFIGPDYRT